MTPEQGVVPCKIVHVNGCFFMSQSLTQLIENGKSEEAIKLLNAGTDPNEKTGRDSPLYTALGSFSRGQLTIDVIRVLLEKGIIFFQFQPQ